MVACPAVARPRLLRQRHGAAGVAVAGLRADAAAAAQQLQLLPAAAAADGRQQWRHRRHAAGQCGGRAQRQQWRRPERVRHGGR